MNETRTIVLRRVVLCLLLTASYGYSAAACAGNQKGGEKVHDAEYYTLEA